MSKWLRRRIRRPSRAFLQDLILPSSFILPVLILYLLYPSSFEITFGTGRAPYLIFLWIACLEAVVFWRKLSSVRHRKFGTAATVALAFFMIVPTVYVIAFSYFGLDHVVVDLGRFLGVPEGSIFGSDFVELHWPVAFEFALFSVCFSSSAWILYRREGFSKLAVAFVFLWAATGFNLVDTFFPVGKVWILQIFVPVTVNSAADVLRAMGYGAVTKQFTNPIYGFGTSLVVFKNQSVFSAIVFWPSAGVHSMIIYTLTILLFVSSIQISIVKKIAIFIVGAVGTFITNVLRIVTIVKIGLENGSLAAQYFHDYYGEFFFISWMVIYLSIIIFAPRLVRGLGKRIRGARVDTLEEADTSLPKNEPHSTEPEA